MSNLLLFPLRLLVFLVRLPVALLDMLVYLLYAVVLYALAVPGFLLHAAYQIVMYPLRRARGREDLGSFRAGWFLTGPIKMYLRKQREIVAWLWASWRTLRSRKQREASRDRQRDHYQAYFQREEPVLSAQQPSRLPGNQDGTPDIPVFGESRPGPGKQRVSPGSVVLSCPHCGVASATENEYMVQNDGAVIYQFKTQPGRQYTGENGAGRWRCLACDQESHLVEVLENKGAYNLKTKQWDPEPAWESGPTARVRTQKGGQES